ncbi:glycine--tRNA ligase subunit beta [Hahella sp. SMD15-11]|uniref:Glycine--tRNA ligase beta subunit n=1 Tax=Thermohahella caldifontis TaxID=3142973 RepID=A0AB39UU51_9GAMM
MQVADFLVELGTEELPPKALLSLARAFAEGIENGLRQARLDMGQVRHFAAPRRLAVKVSSLAVRQPDQVIERLGPAVAAAWQEDGTPTKACEGFARSCGTTPDQLITVETDKGARVGYRTTESGKPTAELLPEIVSQALDALPIPKRMRWGARRVEFVRPVHWLVMLLGEEVVPGTILGLEAGRETRGHRYHAPQALSLTSPADYPDKLAESGYVLADFEARRERIRQQVTDIARQTGGQAVIDDALLDEVTALNEWPVALLGNFEETFLEVPQEALISTMKENQKYFHVVDDQGRMLPHFITIANIESRDPRQVVEGNERVIRPRLSDARFFFQTDRKVPLTERLESLRSIVFQKDLGTLYDKAERMSRLAGHIAALIGSDPEQAALAARLAKADLATEMVLEFPELQGIMGGYYARHEGYPEAVASAIREHYQPRFAGDAVPANGVSQAVALADKIDTLVGIFGINQPPTGTRDPFGLRRAALGILRIIIENALPVDLQDLYREAASLHGNLPNANAVEDAVNYTLERLFGIYEEQGIPTPVVQAVMAKRPTAPLDFDRRVLAVAAFLAREEAEALAAASKRVGNILAKQAEGDLPAFDPVKLTDEAEKALAEALDQVEQEVSPLLTEGRYGEAMAALARLRAPVDRFFDEVMVMAEEPDLRANRIALLGRLHKLLTWTADIAHLQAAK